jgi:hypothetical protein
MWEKAEEQAKRTGMERQTYTICGCQSAEQEERKREKESWGKIFFIIMSMYIITLIERTRRERQSRARASFPIEQYVTTVC